MKNWYDDKPTEITPDLIQKLKKQHGDILEYTVDGKVGLFKRPDRKTASLAASMAERDPMGSNEVIAKNCFLAGDKDIVEVDMYFFGLGVFLQQLIKRKLGELKEL